ncbi:MAG: radical SAM/SPASM domain Clo7bot peptide maturase [Clostridia bacterium]|nr:radical SAM/SPASM domain Clo7bot peptide maturase [Clostridia bacterium]
MKASKYNKIWKMEDGANIAFNYMTCALAEVDEDFINILNQIENIRYDELEDEKKKLVDDMLYGNFIIKDNIDELSIIKYRHYAGKFNDSALGLTIAPTLACNFGCPYCFENEKKGMMKPEVQQSVIDMVENWAKQKKDISITWYGGEPLLAINLISDMSEKIIKICEENGANYSSFIVTNGYLISDEIIERLKKAKIDGAQITLDGPPDVHNQRRKLKNSTEDTFYKILENTKKMKQAGISPSIRINVDKTNMHRVSELLDILKENDLQDLKVGLGQVTAYTEACSSIVEHCMNVEEYAKNTLENQKLLISKGFVNGGYPDYPGIKANYCCADASSSFVLDPEGYMYKCWNDVGSIDTAVGNVTKFNQPPDDEMFMRNVNYILWSPFNHEECVSCSYLPICMGGCPYNGAKNGMKPECEKWKYNLDEVLRLTYTQKKDLPEEECACKDGCSCG